MANSVDPDQMLHSAASDLGLHCLLRYVCPNIDCCYGIMSPSLWEGDILILVGMVLASA